MPSNEKCSVLVRIRGNRADDHGRSHKGGNLRSTLFGWPFLRFFSNRLRRRHYYWHRKLDSACGLNCCAWRCLPTTLRDIRLSTANIEHIDLQSATLRGLSSRHRNIEFDLRSKQSRFFIPIQCLVLHYPFEGTWIDLWRVALARLHIHYSKPCRPRHSRATITKCRATHAEGACANSRDAGGDRSVLATIVSSAPLCWACVFSAVKIPSFVSLSLRVFVLKKSCP